MQNTSETMEGRIDTVLARDVNGLSVIVVEAAGLGKLVALGSANPGEKGDLIKDFTLIDLVGDGENDKALNRASIVLNALRMAHEAWTKKGAR